MSSISPVGSEPPTPISGVEPTSMMSPPPVPYLQGTLDGVSGMLSLSPSALRTALRSGSSIADVAAQKGVNTSAIVTYIEQQVQQQRSAQGKQPIDSQVLDQVVNAAVQRHRGGHHHHATATPIVQTGTQGVPTPTGSPPPSSFLDLLA